MGYLPRQLREIGDDAALRLYGAALALTHSLSMLYWRDSGVLGFLGRGTEAICWPLLPGCEGLRVFGPGPLKWGLRWYFAAGLAVAALFLVKRLCRAAYAGLLALTIFKLLFLALDFRLRLNQHYMVLWVSTVYLFVPGKRQALRVLLVLFYVWASTLKFNADWISGAALPTTDWIIPAAWTTAACIYVIFLEAGVSWGLLAASPWIFWGALGQFALFHALSWQQVGFFFPSLMFLLLLVFPLARLIRPPAGTAPRREGRRLEPATLGIATAFSLFQLVPLLIPGDAALTGEGRPYALHMVDAGVTCRGWADVRRDDGTGVRVSLTGGTVARISCDPIVLAERARNICQGTSSLVRDAADLDLHLVSRRRTMREFQTVIDLPGFCTRGIRYDPLGRNPWIRISGGGGE